MIKIALTPLKIVLGLVTGLINGIASAIEWTVEQSKKFSYELGIVKNAISSVFDFLSDLGSAVLDAGNAIGEFFGLISKKAPLKAGEKDLKEYKKEVKETGKESSKAYDDLTKSIVKFSEQNKNGTIKNADAFNKINLQLISQIDENLKKQQLTQEQAKTLKESLAGIKFDVKSGDNKKVVDEMEVVKKAMEELIKKGDTQSEKFLTLRKRYIELEKANRNYNKSLKKEYDEIERLIDGDPLEVTASVSKDNTGEIIKGIKDKF